MGLISKLTAVNQMLLTAGENLVADLENASGVDTGIAEHILEQCSLDFQMRGMANNKVVRKMNTNLDYKLLLPNPDGDEAGVISAELISFHVNSDNTQIKVRVLSDSPARLWNTTDDTDIFKANEDYYVELIMKLMWENLDTPVQRAILSSAMREYQILTQGDSSTDAYLALQQQVFNAKGKAADINDKKKNIFSSGDPSLQSAVNRNAYTNDPSRFRFWRTRG
jgi:hypothetical protein